MAHTMTPQELIESRDKTHGFYPDTASIVQFLKRCARDARNWERCDSKTGEPIMSDAQREAVDMIMHKLGRVLNGDPNEPDHWQDIAGYATLVVNLLTKGTHL